MIPNYRLSFLFLLFSLHLSAQQLEADVKNIEAQLTTLEAQENQLKDRLETVKLQMVRRDLEDIGLPSANYIMHSAMALEYSEPHEQARWVAHIIRPEVISGTAMRTNDFREDPKIMTGTAIEQDYFLKRMKPDSTFEYDGFGYDRGHLAPSADFRWSEKALSESYYYSNMSPQLADFNREGWAELEGLLRAYLNDHPTTQLYVVTGPILEANLPVIERSVNKVAIPKYYFKVALDVQSGQAIGFLMPNAALSYPISHFAISIDEVEKATGLDFFSKLPDDQEKKLESFYNKQHWFPELAGGDVEPLYQPNLPSNHFNTVVGARYAGTGDEIFVCGTVVSTRYSRSGNLWLNLDKKFPNQVFSVFIRKKDLVNFSFDPQAEWDGQQVCFSGKVENFNGTPTMNLEREEDAEK